jgi:hypothetical protein
MNFLKKVFLKSRLKIKCLIKDFLAKIKRMKKSDIVFGALVWATFAAGIMVIVHFIIEIIKSKG